PPRFRLEGTAFVDFTTCISWRSCVTALPAEKKRCIGAGSGGRPSRTGGWIDARSIPQVVSLWWVGVIRHVPTRLATTRSTISISTGSSLSGEDTESITAFANSLCGVVSSGAPGYGATLPLAYLR